METVAITRLQRSTASPVPAIVPPSPSTFWLGLKESLRLCPHRSLGQPTSAGAGGQLPAGRCRSDTDVRKDGAVLEPGEGRLACSEGKRQQEQPQGAII